MVVRLVCSRECDAKDECERDQKKNPKPVSTQSDPLFGRVCRDDWNSVGGSGKVKSRELVM